MKKWQKWTIVLSGLVVVVSAMALYINQISGMTHGEKIIFATMLGIPLGAIAAAISMAWEDRG